MSSRSVRALALLFALVALGQDLVIVVREPDGRVRPSILEHGGPSSLDL